MTKTIPKIVTIGGGAIGRNGAQPATTAIDREIVRLSGKAHPKVTFIPTASGDDLEYGQAFLKQYQDRLECRVSILHLARERPSFEAIRKAILGADIIYVGGGNTLKMVNRWKLLGVIELINKAKNQGAVLCGLSAGMICWYRCGNSDSRMKFPGDTTLIKVSGLGYIDALGCPHYDTEKHRPASLKAMMKKTPGVAIAMEDNSALEIVGNQWRVIASQPKAKGYRIYWSRGKYFKEPLLPGKAWRPVKMLNIKESVL